MSLQITLIRHGKADKSLPNHREHPLSPEGCNQALNLRIKLGHPQFDLVCHSVLRRTKETAVIVSNSTFASMIEIPGLFYEEGDPREQAIEFAWERLGHGTLFQYFEVESEIASLANEAKGAILGKIAETGAKNVLVVGHDLITTAICRSILGQDEPFLNFVCNETEGFRLTIDDEGQVTSVEILKNQ